MIKPDMASIPTTHPKILVVGGGFGGVKTALELSRLGGAQVTLISATPVFAYYPQLYHAATGGSRAEASILLSELFTGHPVEFVQATVTGLDASARVVTTSTNQTFSYDELVLALGAITNYFGIAGLEQYSYNIKTIDGAEKFKQHLHKQLVDERRPDVNYVVVGAGPTGCELAGALGQYLRGIVKRHGLEANYRIDLVEASPRILPRSSERTARKVARRLEKLGVSIMTGAVVEAETADGLQLKGQSLASRTVVWTAGVANNPFYKANAGLFTIAKNGRIVVDAHLEARPHVYVIGDNADTPHSGLAETAVNDAKYVAADIRRKLRSRPRPDYRQPTPTPVLPIGDRWAAATLGPVEVYGYAGWILRRLGDLVAYHSIESFPAALAVWHMDGRREDDCPVCNSPARATKSATH